VGVAVLGDFRAIEWTWQNIFWKSTEMYKTNKNVIKNIDTFFKSVGVAVLCGLWEWQHGSTNLRCVFVSILCLLFWMLNLNLLAIIVVDTLIRTWLERLGYLSWSIIYLLYVIGNASFCLLYILVCPLILRVTRIKSEGNFFAQRYSAVQ